MGLRDLKDLERADIEALQEAARRRERRERRAKRAARSPRWTAWCDARAREFKIAAAVIGGATAVVAGGTAFFKAVKQAWIVYSTAREVGPPVQPPPPSSGASTFVDRVDRPASPASSPRPAPPPTKD